MGLQELRAGSPQGFSDLRWAYESCGPAARRGFFETQDGLRRVAGWQPAGVFRPKMGFEELRAGSPQGFSDLRWAYKSCGLAARRGFQT